MQKESYRIIRTLSTVDCDEETGRGSVFRNRTYTRFRTYLCGEHLSSVADGDSLDWKEIPAEEITQRVLTQVKGGSIILFHNAAPHTPEALPGIIEALQRDGYTLCTVSDLLVEGPYTIDSAGVQHPASESS